MNTTSPSLLLRLRDPSEQEAWSRFVRIYAPLIERWVRPFGLTPEDAEDLVQNVFSSLVRELPRFEYDSSRSFRAWLCTVTRNTVRDYQRRCGIRPLTNSHQCLDDVAEGNPYETTAEEFRRYVTNRALLVMESDFEPTTWKAFWEVVTEGRPGAQVAAELKISVNAVYLAKARVLRRLREELAGMLDDD